MSNKQMGPNETEKLLHSKGNHKQDQKKTKEWEKIFTNHISGKELIPRNIENS